MNAANAPNGLHHYDRLFYEYLRDGALRSARALLPRLINILKPASVLDVGCGAGAWLSVYQELGIDDIVGLDGAYVDRDLLLIESSTFRPHDLTQGFDLGRRFDLVQCLEVAEHLPASVSETLVDSLTLHSDKVLFSAAIPGQGGEDHINEQPYEFWRDLFSQRDYQLFDFLRPVIQRVPGIESWYRHNVLFFAHESIVDSLPAPVRQSRVDARAKVVDYAPLLVRAGRRALQSLSPRTVSRLAVMKHRLLVRSLARR